MRCTLSNFVFIIGFFWLLILVYFYSTSMKDISPNDEDEKSPKLAQIEINSLNQPKFEDFEDNFIELPSPSLKKILKSFKFRNREPFIWPSLTDEVTNLHALLNLSNPGQMGQPVVLPSQLPPEISEKIAKSWEIYSINEFVSNLIPLDRDLPDIRPEYCRTASYAHDLPMTSVIMVFHNEPLSMILRSVFAVFKRTSERLLKEIVLVDDCSTHGENNGFFLISCF